MTAQTNLQPKKRLVSLDVLRGITVFVMIIVNNGAGPVHFQMLDHSKWNGLTVCDLVFPFFLFMVGVSIPFAMKSKASQPPAKRYGSILWRTFKLFAVGVLLHAWDMFVWGDTPILPNLRLWGVLQRIAICYCICTLLVMWVNPKHIWKIACSLLIIYAIMLTVGNGYAQDNTNLAAIIDRLYLSEAHLYHKSPIDPEGLMGTISALAHTLIGVMVGRAISDKNIEIDKRILNLFLFSTVLGIIGYLISFEYPLNKRIWSPSYTLVTCSMATSILALLTYIIDVKGQNKWCSLFRFFGLHAFTLYILSEALAPISGYINAPETIHDILAQFLDPRIASLIYALLFDATVGVIGFIYIKTLNKFNIDKK